MAQVRAAAILVGLLCPVAAAAQTKTRFTLEEAIELAQNQTRAVVRARADLEIMDAQRAQALAAVLPSLDVVVRAREIFQDQPITELRTPVFCSSDLSTFSDCASTDDFVAGPFVDRRQINDNSAPQFTLVLTARQLIYDGGRWWAQLGLQDDRIARFEALYEAVLNNVRLDVARSFYRLEGARRARGTFELRVSLGEAQLERARALLAAGNGKPADVANAERNLAEDRVTLAQRRFAESRLRRALNLSMARAADAPLEPVVPADIATATRSLSKMRLPTPAAVKDAARAHRPDLVASQFLTAEYDKRVTLEESRFGPNLAMDATYSKLSRRPDRVFWNFQTNFIATFGFTLRWNLLQGGRDLALLEQAHQNVRKLQADYQDLERRVLSEALDRLENLRIQIQVYGLARSALGSAEDAVDLARALFEEGKNTALELRDAELKFTNAQLAAINARLNVALAREELRRAVGLDPVVPSAR